MRPSRLQPVISLGPHASFVRKVGTRIVPVPERVLGPLFPPGSWSATACSAARWDLPFGAARLHCHQHRQPLFTHSRLHGKAGVMTSEMARVFGRSLIVSAGC
jgi:hypothetical protein